jgi:dTDP-4-dehydrorhamnose reductase
VTRYLITGARGQLGTDLAHVLRDRDVTALGRDELDITNASAVREAVEGYDFVINTAAYTRVDDAESHEADAAMINAVGPSNLAVATADAGSLLVHVSTDYVFDGTATTPYHEDAPTRPASAYGRTKADGERRALHANPDGTFIVRTAWLYGEHGSNFAKTMLALGSARPEVSVVTDQVGQPTWTMDLARQIVALMDSDAPAGIYHGTASGQATWFEFARELFRLSGLDPENVKPTDSSAYVRPAPRPAYSVLGHDAWLEHGLEPIRDWRLGLREAFDTGALKLP